MKLLFDQNISPRIVRQVISAFPDSHQVRYFKLDNAPDHTIFLFAKNNEFTIVTFDSDFADLSILYGFPPKIVWLRTGNLTTRSISYILKQNITVIEMFIKSNQGGILEILNTDPITKA